MKHKHADKILELQDTLATLEIEYKKIGYVTQEDWHEFNKKRQGILQEIYILEQGK